MENEEVVPLTKEQQDEAWNKVVKDRDASTRADGEQPDTKAADAGDKPVEKPAGDKPADKAAEPDPYAGLPEPTRKLLEGLEAKVSKAEERANIFDRQLGTANGTIGGLKNQLDKSRAMLEALKPTVDSVEASKKADEERKAADKVARRKVHREKALDVLDQELVDEILPEIVTPPADAKPVEKPAEKPVAKVEEKVAESIDPDERRVLILQRELSDRVPGWMQMRKTPEFKAWLPKQPDLLVKANSWDVEEAASVFKAFEKHKSDAAKVAQVEKDRADRLRRGETVQGRGSSAGDVDTSPDAVWNQAKRDREKARAA